MKYVRFSTNGKIRYGVLKEDHIEVREIFSPKNLVLSKVSLEKAVLLSPVQPSKVICIGLNYRNHAAEMNLGIPTEPVVFMKPSTTVIGSGESIEYPSISRLVDYEAELAIVMGKKAKNVKEKDASSYILGYTAANDVTARDLQQKDGQWTRAKSFDTFLPLGPWIETEIDPGNLLIELRLNGIIKQSSSTADLIFSPSYLVEYISQVMTLLPGDVIITGTPSGVGPLNVGDVVEVEIEGIGTLKNSVTAVQP